MLRLLYCSCIHRAASTFHKKKDVRDGVSIIDIAGNNIYIETDSSWTAHNNNERKLRFLYECGGTYVLTYVTARSQPEDPQWFHNGSSCFCYHSLPLLIVGRRFLPLCDHYLWLHLGFSFPIIHHHHRYQMMMTTWSSLKRVQVHIINGKLFFRGRGWKKSSE